MKARRVKFHSSDGLPVLLLPLSNPKRPILLSLPQKLLSSNYNTLEPVPALRVRNGLELSFPFQVGPSSVGRRSESSFEDEVGSLAGGGRGDEETSLKAGGDEEGGIERERGGGVGRGGEG